MRLLIGPLGAFLAIFPATVSSFEASNIQFHDGHDCCQWNHAPLDLPPTDHPSKPEDPVERHELQSNDPDDVVNYLSHHPDIDANRWTELSLRAFEASPKSASELLRLAVEVGYPGVVEALLKGGAQPVVKDEFGDHSCDAIVAASIKGDVESMRFLVNAGADPDMTLTSHKKLQPGWLGNRGAHATFIMSSITWMSSPIQIAINNNHTALVEWLLATGRVNLARRQHGESLPPLHSAISIGHMPTLKATMKHYAAVDNGNYLETLFHNHTFFVYAAWTGDRDVIHYVIDRFIAAPEDTDSGAVFRQFVDKHLPFMEPLLGSLFSSPKASPSVIRYFFDYLGELEHLHISTLDRLLRDLRTGRAVAAKTDNVDVLTLLIQLDDEIMSRLYAPGERTHHSSMILRRSFCSAFYYDSIRVIQYLVEDKGMDPDEADSCETSLWGYKAASSLWNHEGNFTSPELSGLLWSIRVGNVAVTNYLMDNTNKANISGLNDQVYSWIFEYLDRRKQFASHYKPRASLDEIKHLLHSLLQQGASVSHISPPSIPDFRNKQVVVDVMEGDFGEHRPGVCLCWGYKDTIRPKPQWTKTPTIRLEMKEEDREWWIRLSTLLGVVQEPAVSSEEL